MQLKILRENNWKKEKQVDKVNHQKMWDKMLATLATSSVRVGIFECPQTWVSGQTALWDWQHFCLIYSSPVDDQQPEIKAEQAPAPAKKEALVVAETKVLDGATPSAPSGKKKNSAKKQKTEPGINFTTVSISQNTRMCV